MIRAHRAERGGFTLLEIIMALVLVALGGSILITLVSRSTSGVHRPRELLTDSFSIRATMENIVSRAAVLDDVDQLSGEVGAEGSDMANTFGTYTVEHNRFVAYDADGDETAAGTNTLLKVSIFNARGETLTRLFARD
jgi:prepilin-type N-terminal cleavage/methylation domain-containing protein